MDLNNIKFTFYGDLLGISNLYSIDQELAKEKLSAFYDLVYSKFKNFALNREGNIFIFSDSLFITGSRLEKTIQILGDLYESLFEDNSFFRGAIVSGKLDFDPRIQLENLEKRLPTTDVLFRAVSLEKSINGMRLLIEKEVAKKILPSEWLTDDLYRRNIKLVGYDKYDFRRKIILTSEWNSYEYLWLCHLNPSELFSGGIAKLAQRMTKSPYEMIDERLLQVPKAVKIHIEETRELFQRAAYRYKITDDSLDLYDKIRETKNSS